MAQFLRPDADIAISSWAGTPTTSGIYQNVDESTASNTDFVYSGNNPNGSGCELGLSNPGVTPGSGTCTVRYRDAWLNTAALTSSGTAVDLDVQLLQGATVIASSGVHAVTGAWTARSFTFAASAVTDWSDLRVKFVATGGGGNPSNRRGGGVSWVEVETPDGSTEITGTGAGSQPLSGSGAGSVDDTGAGAGSAPLTGSAAGSVDDTGTGTGTMPMSGSGSGYALTTISDHPTLTTGLVSHWKLDEASGTRADSHGPNDLTDINTVTSGAGKIGNAASFASANSERLEISDASQTGLEPSASGFSFNVWYNPTTQPNTVDMASKWSSGQASFICSISSNGAQMRLLTSTSGSFEAGNNKAVTLATGLSTGTFYMLTWAFDLVAGTCKMYKNGVLEGTLTGYSTSIFNGTAAFCLGANAGGGELVDGLLDEGAFFSKVLSDSEVSDLWNGSAGLPFSATSIDGTGAGSMPISGSAAGSVDDSGTGAGTAPISGSGAGSVDDEGTGAGSMPLSGTGAGDVGSTPIDGTGDGSMPITGSGAGSVDDTGTGAGSMPLSGAGAGDVADDGTGAGAMPLAGAGAGSVDVDATGSGSAPLTGSGAGAVDDEGTGSGTMPLSGSGDGVVGSAPIEGTGSGSMPLSGAGAGDVADDGVGSGTVPLSGSGSGSVDDTGSGSGSAPLTGAGAGSVDDDGTGAGSMPISGSAAGSVDDSGTGAGTAPISGSGAGSVDDEGTAAGAMPLTGTGVGTVVDPAAINHIVLAGYRRPSFRAPGGMVAANAPGTRVRAKAIGGGS